jgi:hypothetical protein
VTRYLIYNLRNRISFYWYLVCAAFYFKVLPIFRLQFLYRARGNWRIMRKVLILRLLFLRTISSKAESSKDGDLKLSRAVAVNPDLHEAFDCGGDREKFMYSSRFNHLKISGFKDLRVDADFQISKIIGWVEQNKVPSQDMEWESYTISDRIYNWLMFLHFTNHESCDVSKLKEIHKSIIIQGYHLVNHLELHGRFTNNHIINNAISLILLGVKLEIERFSEIGTEIMYKYYGEMFVHDFLVENSTHYHMLYTSKFLELYSVLASSGIPEDDAFLLWLRPKILGQLVHCQKLQSIYSAKMYPLFGDISPDLAPSYLAGYPFSQNKVFFSQWYKNFELKDKVNSIVQSLGVQEYNNKESSVVMRKNGFELWVWIKNGAYGSHGHSDSGSIVLYHEGLPVFVDPGRNTYEDSSNGIYCDQEVHNLPHCSRYSWDLADKRFRDNEIYNSRVGYEYFKDCCLSLVVESWDKRLKIERTIELMDDGLIINDNLLLGSETWSSTYITPRRIVMINDAHLNIEDKFQIQIKSEDKFKTHLLPVEYYENYGDILNGSQVKIEHRNNITVQIKYSSIEAAR